MTTNRSALPRMRKEWKPRQRIVAYAARRRIFTVADVLRELNVAAAHGIDEALRKGDIVRHATSVYSVQGVPPDDPRVLQAIATVNEEPLPRNAVHAAMRRGEDAIAAAMESSLPGESLDGRIDRFLKRNPVFLRDTLKNAALGQTDRILKDLVRDGRVRRVDALLMVPEIEIDDERVDTFLAGHGADAETVASEIESARKMPMDIAGIRYRVEKRGRTDPDGTVHPRPTRVHVLVPGCPPIYGIARGSNRTTGIDWHSASVSRLTAETIARKALHPMPATLSELILKVDDGTAPVEIVRRSIGVPIARNGDRRGAWERPDARKVPLGTRTIVTVDTSEDDDVLGRLTSVRNLHVVRAKLTTGDYHLRRNGLQATIERKTITDLVASLEDGRLSSQIPRLATLGHPAFIVLEGDIHGTEAISPTRLARIQTRLASRGIGLIVTRDTASTAYAIASVARDVLDMPVQSQAAA